MAQLPHLVGSEQRIGRKLQKEGLQRGQPKGNRQQQPLAADFAEHDLHQLLEAVDHGPAQLIGPALRIHFLQCRSNGGGDIADKDGLKPGMAAADQGQRGQKPRQTGEPVEEFVLRPKQQ